MIKRIFTVLAISGLALAATSTLTACNTVEGFGQDVERTGEAIEGAGSSGYNE